MWMSKALHSSMRFCWTWKLVAHNLVSYFPRLRRRHSRVHLDLQDRGLDLDVGEDVHEQPA